MDRVPLLGLGVELPHRAGLRFGGVGRADHLPQARDGVVPLERESQTGPRRHEGHQGAVKGTLPMHFVEGLGLCVAELDEAGGADGEPGGLQVRNDLSREASLHRVGLDDGECEHVKGLGAKGLRG